MKVIGLIGGISWVSTIDYYRYINQDINKTLGGNEFAECIIYSMNYGEIIRHNEAGDFDATYDMLFKACMHLKDSGAAAIVLCANTMHMFADKLQAALTIPLIHIATATAMAIEDKGLKKVGFLGTKPTMEMNFFKDKLSDRNIEIVLPDEDDRLFVHDKIFTELLRGQLSADTKARYLDIIENLINSGAEGIILGCTEIPLLIKQDDVKVPVFDTTLIHANAAVAFALS